MYSARKIDDGDYDTIRIALSSALDKALRANRKRFQHFIDIDQMLLELYAMDTAYIVSDTYLVAYGVQSPWYAKDDILILFEILVLRIGSDADFKVVPAFLEARAQEAGCVLVTAGTALTVTDTALASLYQRSGFNVEALSLIKEPGWAI